MSILGDLRRIISRYRSGRETLALIFGVIPLDRGIISHLVIAAVHTKAAKRQASNGRSLYIAVIFLVITCTMIYIAENLKPLILVAPCLICF